MNNSRLFANSTTIIAQMLERGWSARDAANAAGIRTDVLARCLKSDCPISYRTAGKLRNTFGACSVKILDPVGK